MKGTKNNIWKVFAINLGKSILGICILIAVGFGSYKISYHFLSKNATNVNTDKDSIKEIIKEAKTEDISKNLIYVCNEKDQITHMMVEICNTKTNNLDYVTIPTKNDYTIPTTMYRKLCTISENIPQIMRISKLKQYFADEQQAYGYGSLIVEKMIGTVSARSGRASRARTAPSPSAPQRPSASSDGDAQKQAPRQTALA